VSAVVSPDARLDLADAGAAAEVVKDLVGVMLSRNHS
jgi:hypothetical protein